MDLPVAVALAVVAALVTLVLCDLAGSIARAKGRSYWGFFGLGLLLWFPALITALAVRDSGSAAAGAAPGRLETSAALLVMVLAVLALAAAVVAAIGYAA